MFIFALNLSCYIGSWIFPVPFSESTGSFFLLAGDLSFALNVTGGFWVILAAMLVEDCS